jgi:hypothetical protein
MMIDFLEISLFARPIALSDARSLLHDQPHHSPRLKDEDDTPKKYADTGCGGRDILYDFDLLTLLNGNEIAGGLDGTVEQFSLKHEGSSGSEKKKIDPLPKEKEDHKDNCREQ